MTGVFHGVQLKQQYLQNHPELEVTFSIYPTAPWKEKLAMVINVLSWVAIVLLFWGDSIFAKLGMRPPALYEFFMNFEDVRNSKMLVTLAIFFLNSFAQGNLHKTGAFEVYYNSTPVYSKLAQGVGKRVVMKDMLDGLEAAMGASK
mmetsp:Transcript_10070/g.28543  ORF Transcript_10070/g.28543 Transcript_10070/m.28543 type:complete len:146 (-) Transcript_10070:1396-1833(-)